MFDKISETGLFTVQRILDYWSSSKADSLIEYTQDTRVEPLTLLDSTLVFNQGSTTLMQSLLKQYCSYYAQSFGVQTRIGNIEVGRQLSKLNPTRDPMQSLAGTVAAGWTLSREDFADKLPDFSGNLDLQAAGSARNLGRAGNINNPQAELKAVADLSVGQMFTVEITDGRNKAPIHVSARLHVNAVTPERLVEILSIGNKDDSIKSLNRDIRYGDKHWWYDGILAKYAIDAHRENLIKDHDGLYEMMYKRRRNNGLASILSFNPTVSDISGIVIMSPDTLSKLEIAINGSFDDYRTRQKILKDTAIMIVAVYDPGLDRVKFYYHSIPRPSEVSIRDLRSSSSKEGESMMDMLKAFQLGSNPHF